MADPGEQVRTALVGAVETAADVSSAVRSAMKSTVVGAFKDAGEIAANAAVFAGTVKSAMIGVADAGRGAIEGVRGAVGGAVLAASETGVDLAHAASSTMRGVLEAVGDLGGDSQKVIRAAAEGMIETAAGLGAQALSNVRRGLLEVAAIPRDVIDAAMQKADDDASSGTGT